MKHKFTPEQQLLFSSLSGDYNPMHLDEIVARRLINGARVVHGIHTLLHSLNYYLSHRENKRLLQIIKLKVCFIKPIKVNDTVNITITEKKTNTAKITLHHENTLTTKIEVHLGELKKNSELKIPSSLPEKVTSQVLSPLDMPTAKGELPLHLHLTSTEKLYPALLCSLTHQQIAIILATTRIVGVYCPGLHSLYSELSLDLSESKQQRNIVYQVDEFDQRFNLAYINITAPNMLGKIKAFCRPTPIKQSGYLELKQQISHDDFSDQKVLIIGGSRGLGEVAAKLLAAGGAEVTITYHKGKKDADTIVDDINCHGGNAKCLQYNVLEPKATPIESIMKQWQPTHLYYFATPFIFSGHKNIFSNSLFNHFCAYYITGFNDVLTQIKTPALKGIFYPSSVAIDELPSNMGEYSVAKLASELFCDVLTNSMENIYIYKPRFPRVATDQTVSIMPTFNENPVTILKTALKRFVEQVSIKSKKNHF